MALKVCYLLFLLFVVFVVSKMVVDSTSSRSAGNSVTPTPSSSAGNSVTASTPTPRTPEATPSRDTGVKMYYLAMGFPCAKEESTVGVLAGALVDRDEEALKGLEEQGKTLWLDEGTKFQGLDFQGLVLGYVRSGRNIGKECYLINDALTLTPPRKR